MTRHERINGVRYHVTTLAPDAKGLPRRVVGHDARLCSGTCEGIEQRPLGFAGKDRWLWTDAPNPAD